jgi:RNA polymerase sigma factor (sigma-70 family)
MDSLPDNPPEGSPRGASLPEACLAAARRYFAESGAEAWQLSFQTFLEALSRSAAKRYGRSDISAAQFEDYAGTLHLRDLALARACAQGSERAWEEFMAGYRGYLRAAASAILRRPAGDAAVVELSDSLFTDLYGLGPTTGSGSTAPEKRSLFRYFHGRSSLKTWLRAVLAQRYVDVIRASRKFESLDDQPGDGESRRIVEPVAAVPPSDPHREQYLEKFRVALAAALAALEPHDRARLQMYYAEEQTLAEIGRELGEHESSVSRNLERVRKELRGVVEGLLRAGKAAANGGPSSPGMDDAQIALCFQYAGEDAGIDLDKLFEARKSPNLRSSNRTVKP